MNRSEKTPFQEYLDEKIADGTLAGCRYRTFSMEEVGKRILNAENPEEEAKKWLEEMFQDPEQQKEQH